MKRKRVWRRRPAGLYNEDAPYWKGRRAEHIVKERVRSYTKKRKKKT